MVTLNEQFDIGDRPTITVTFSNEAGTATSPSTVVFLVRTPAGVESSNAATSNPSTGVYTYTFPTITESGVWSWRAKGTAGLIAATEGRFNVRTSVFTTP
jgi:hypothetical protein